MSRPDYVAGESQNYYGNGINHSNSRQTKTFYYDRAGIKAANAKKVFTQFTDSRQMPKHTGKEYKVKVWHHAYDRLPFEDMSIENNSRYSESFSKYGYLSSRDVATIEDYLYGKHKKDGSGSNVSDNGQRLLEGEGRCNEITLKANTISTQLENFGQMISYTDDVITFSEDDMEVYYRQILGESANQLMEDLIQYDMLATTNVMYPSSCTSMEQLGANIGTGEVNPISQVNDIEESYKINYKLIQTLKKKLIMFRCPPHSQLTDGDIKVGTKPVPKCYVAIIPPALLSDVENINKGNVYNKNDLFHPVETYASQQDIIEGEIGRVGNLRFIVAEQMLVERGKGAEVDAGYVGSLSYTGTLGDDARFDVFPILIPCAESFATIGLIGENKIQFRHFNPKQIDSANVYGTNGYFSYRMRYAGLITRVERLIRINVLASA